MEEVLRRNADARLRVLVVWEPMLFTDWRAPGSTTLARIRDKRVSQFWDPKHVVAQELNRVVKEKPGQPEPACCFDKGLYWDDAIVYEPLAKWREGPKPAFMNGPVWKITHGLENALQDPGAFR